MTPSPSVHADHRSGLIWGFDFADGAATPVAQPAEPEPDAPGLRWLHLNLADQRAQRWIGSCSRMAAPVSELLLALDARPHALVEGEAAAFALPDVQRDFDDGEPRMGMMRVVVMPGLIVTARLHPLRSADVARERIAAGAAPDTPAAALELVLAAQAETVRRIVVDADATVQGIEDELLDSGRTPDARAFVTIRGLMVRMHRLLSGARTVLRDAVEEDAKVPAGLGGVLERAAHRLAALDGDLLSVQSQLRLLREEIDLQATQRTNQNLYILSILTALMMPATLVTGIFGMNTPGLPWSNHPAGALWATGLAIGSAAVVYFALRAAGFMRR